MICLHRTEQIVIHIRMISTLTSELESQHCMRGETKR
tara:strand:- start:703 stop:813 length:111 start_codon:yes stop_codon:yes gene_type:complete